jgi:serine/threonine-protein kinase
MAAALSASQWKALRPVLDAALDLDDTARDAYIEELRLRDPEQVEPLLRMLLRQDQSAPLDQPAAALAADELMTRTQETGEIPELSMRADRHLGQRVGAFELVRLLGAGGMGRVYLAERVQGGFRQRVAIKLIGGVHPGLHLRFAQERQILADLNHPGIARLIDGGETADGFPYLAMEYIDGVPPQEWLAARKHDGRAVLGLFIQIADALAYAHQRGVIHRDIKPANVLVDEHGRAKLLDFGIARVVEGSGSGGLTGAGLGPMTPDYAAPELFRGGRLGPATDLYQYGVLLFRLLGGQLPYSATSRDPLAFASAVDSETRLSLSQVLQAGESTRPEWLVGVKLARMDSLIARLLARQPERRPADFEQVAGALRAMQEPLAQAPELPPGRARWSWLALPLALLVLAGLLAWDGAWWSSKPPAAADAWEDHPALTAFGLRTANLHPAADGTVATLRQAFLAEARGDAAAARALFEVAHSSDPLTPVPALMLSYWMPRSADQATRTRWQEARDSRLAQVDDAYLDLFARFIDADRAGSSEALRDAAAMLELRPEAWFLHLARAHRYNALGARQQALTELQAIAPASLAHRKFIDVIADRASLGDLAGARSLAAQLQGEVSPARRLALEARLAFSAGELRQSRDLFWQAASAARDEGDFSLEARARLWAGLFSGALDERAKAKEQLRLAQVRLRETGMLGYAAEAGLALMQLAALDDDQPALAQAREAAEAMLQLTGEAYLKDHYRIAVLRLAPGEATELPCPACGAGEDPQAPALIEVRLALLRGAPEQARQSLQQLYDEGIGSGMLQEEAALLARELGITYPPLLAIDPPFGPYSRFVARWALGEGASVAPQPVSRAPGAEH